MAPMTIVTGDGSKTQVKEESVDQLKAQLRGALLRPGDAGYDVARTIWNAMIDRRPALIARCLGAADVMRAVAFARDHGLLLAVRGGGHNIAGNAVCEGGFMIDLSPMRSVRVDPKARRAHVEPGATLGDFDKEAQAFGLATPLGINSTTGVAGLTLGGGFGWLTRKHGLTVDNLVSADVVTADAKLVHADEKENADLFWAIRGGGGNFGIVTSFEFQLHPVGPEVFAGLVVYPYDQAKQVLTQYRQFAGQMPEDLCIWGVLRKAPPLPFVSPEFHGKEIVALALIYIGEVSKGRATIDPVLGFGKVVGQHVGPVPYTAWQQVLDPLLTPGARNYWKTNNFSDLNDGAIDAIVQAASKLPSPHCEIPIAFIGGQANRVASNATAYAHRDARFVMNVHGRWETPQEDAQGIVWARELFRATAPYATGGAYVNFMTEDEQDRVKVAAYGPNYDRLVQLKKKYDPANLFRMNQNIKPKS